MTTPDDCRTMADVRREIDRLDEQLVALVARRMGYIARAAEIKRRAEDIRDDDRVEDVIAKVRAAARREGLGPEQAEKVWRVLVETSIRHEADLFARARAGGDAGGTSESG